MKAHAVAASVAASVAVLIFGLNYFLVVRPEQRDRETMKEAMTALIVNGDRAEAAVILTGRANARFTVMAQELGKK